MGESKTARASGVMTVCMLEDVLAIGQDGGELLSVVLGLQLQRVLLGVSLALSRLLEAELSLADLHLRLPSHAFCLPLCAQSSLAGFRAELDLFVAAAC